MQSDGLAAALSPELAARPSRIGAKAIGVVAASTFADFLSITPTVVASLGIFLKPIATEFAWPRSEVAGAISVVALANAIFYPIAGRLADRFGPRRVILAGNILLGLAILALSLARNEPFTFYLLFAFAGAAGALPSTMVVAKLIAEWFDKTRGFWLGFCGGVGNASGAILFPMIATALLMPYGWRAGFLGIGAIVLATGIPILFLLLKEAPVRAKATSSEAVALDGVTFKEAIRSFRFWLIFSILPLGAGCMTSMFTTIFPIVTDRGFPADDAVMVIRAFALTTLVAQPLIGLLTDRTSSPKLVAPLYLIAAIGLWLLLHAESRPALILSGVAMGIGAGVEYTILPYLLSRYFGLRELGAISGVAYGGTLLFGAIAPLYLNGIFDLSGNYAIAVYTIAGILLYSSAAILTFGRYRYAIQHRA